MSDMQKERAAAVTLLCSPVSNALLEYAGGERAEHVREFLSFWLSFVPKPDVDPPHDP